MCGYGNVGMSATHNYPNPQCAVKYPLQRQVEATLLSEIIHYIGGTHCGCTHTHTHTQITCSSSLLHNPKLPLNIPQ